MKKLIALALTFTMSAAILAGCGNNSVAVVAPEEAAETTEVTEETTEETVAGDELKTGLAVQANMEAASAAEEDGTAKADIYLYAVTVDGAGVIDSCVIDAVQGKVAVSSEGKVVSEAGEVLSKNELGDDYGMRKASSIGKEWNEQVAAVAEYAVGKTVEELKTTAIDETGAVKDADLATSATLYLGNFISGIEDAVNNAKALGASKGDELVLATINNAEGTDATAEEDGSANVTSNIIVLTKNGDVITSCIIDGVQAKAAFAADGTFAEDANGEVLSKLQLGENYGMKVASSIGKEWNEQMEAFCAYVTGKTFEEVAGIALTETTAPADADLAASVTMSIAGYQALIEKAAK